MTAAMRARRVLAVTAGLAATGAVTGAVCGALALTPLIVSHWLRSTPETHFTPGIHLVLMGARAGATLGAVLGPAVAWGLLRRAPLWRVVTWAAAGTVAGSLAGWALVGAASVPSGPSIGAGALVGIVAGGVALHFRTRLPARVADRGAAT